MRLSEPSFRAGFALLAGALLVCALARPARAQRPPPPSAYEVPLTFRAELYDGGDGRVAGALSLRLSGYAWQDLEAARHFVLVGGEGAVELGGAPDQAGAPPRRLPVSVRVTRRPDRGGLVEVGGDGSQRWALVADLSLQAEGLPAAEVELDAALLLPEEGERKPTSGDDDASDGDASAGEQPLETARARIAALRARGDGGELRVKGGLLGAPPPSAPYVGVLRLETVTAVASMRGVAGREADLILSRIQYIAADYGDVVHDGEVLRPDEHRAQIALLEDALLLSDSLHLPPGVHDKLVAIREKVEAKRPPLEVYEACRGVMADLVTALWGSMTPPAPMSIEQAGPLFAERCAPCHGAAGDGRGQAARGVEPPPAAFRDGAFVDLLSPYRAYSAITLGMRGTAMPAHAALSEGERWALAFYVFSFHHGPSDSQQAVDGARALERSRVGLPSLEELALRTDRDLTTWLGRRLPGPDVEAALAYLRTAGVADAAASPFEAVRRGVRAAAAAYEDDPAAAAAHAADAAKRFSTIAREVRRRDRIVADGTTDALAQLEQAIARRSPGPDVQAAARHAFSTQSGAQAALARLPREGLAAALDAVPKWAQVVIPTAFVVALVLVTRRSLSAQAAATDEASRSQPHRGTRPRLRVELALLLGGLSLAGGFVALQVARAPTARNPGPFELTVKIDSPTPITGGMVILHLGQIQMAEPIRDGAARFKTVPGEYRDRRVKIVALTEPALEATWAPYDLRALTPPVVTLSMAAKR